MAEVPEGTRNNEACQNCTAVEKILVLCATSLYHPHHSVAEGHDTCNIEQTSMSTFQNISL